MILQVPLTNPVQAHAALTKTIWPRVKAETTAGHELVCQIVSREEQRSIEANKYYWGIVLKQISQQASVAGIRYSIDAWHEFFKREILGYEIKKINVAGRKKKHVIRRLKSTTGLSVKKMHEYTQKVEAYAATELGVRFEARIDPDTGEILQ